MAQKTPMPPLQMPSPPQYSTVQGSAPPNPTPSMAPDFSHGPKVRFHHQLKINWKFGMTNYALVERPASDAAPAVYKFAKTLGPNTEVLHNLVFGITQGFSKNVYKLYHTTLVFKDMSHKDAVDYCARHEDMHRFGRFLSGPTHEIKGHFLEEDFVNCESHFKNVLFGICTGMMESRYLIVLSKNPINEAEFSPIVQEMEVACAKSDIAAGMHIEESKDKIQHIIKKFASYRG